MRRAGTRRHRNAPQRLDSLLKKTGHLPTNDFNFRPSSTFSYECLLGKPEATEFARTKHGRSTRHNFPSKAKMFSEQAFDLCTALNYTYNSHLIDFY